MTLAATRHASKTYANPRIDHAPYTGDPTDGTVRTDPKKLLWVGTMIGGGTIGSALTATPGAIILFVVFTTTTLCLGHSLGMHRRFIHRSYRCPMWLEYLFVHFGVLVGIAGPLTMLRTHDLRDWAQRQARCHDYFSHEQPWYRDFLWQVFGSFTFERAPDVVVEKSIVEDPVYQWMEKTWMWQQLPWAVLFFMLGGWGWVFWGICSRVTVSIFGHWVIGYFAHNHGHRDWHVDGAAVQGFNVPLSALITMGESWHNNHHAFPGSAKLGIEPGQWDPGWWVLLGLKKAGLAWDFVLPESIPPRHELQRLYWIAGIQVTAVSRICGTSVSVDAKRLGG